MSVRRVYIFYRDARSRARDIYTREEAGARYPAMRRPASYSLVFSISESEKELILCPDPLDLPLL